MKTLILSALLSLSMSNAFATDDRIAQGAVELSPESSAYLISLIGQQNERKHIEINAYYSEQVEPEFFYLTFFQGGQDGAAVNEEKRAQLFTDFKNIGLAPVYTNGGFFLIHTDVVCKSNQCFVIVE